MNLEPLSGNRPTFDFRSFDAYWNSILGRKRLGMEPDSRDMSYLPKMKFSKLLIKRLNSQKILERPKS